MSGLRASVPVKATNPGFEFLPPLLRLHGARNQAMLRRQRQGCPKPASKSKPVAWDMLAQCHSRATCNFTPPPAVLNWPHFAMRRPKTQWDLGLNRGWENWESSFHLHPPPAETIDR